MWSAEHPSAASGWSDLLAGIAIGVVVPGVALWVTRIRFLAPSARYEPLFAIAIGLVVFAVASTFHGNLFLAAFSAGISVATVGPEVRTSFEQLGESIAELLKLAALLVLGGLVSFPLLAEISWTGWLFALLTLVLVRPVALGTALAGRSFNRRELLAAVWFGPKGFASVVYALLLLDAGIDDADELFHLAALVILVSIVAHSSTDVAMARWLDRPDDPPVSDRGAEDPDLARRVRS